jgi:prepilin-type N-terminal cleavage/methylation domain-containing protein
MVAACKALLPGEFGFNRGLKTCPVLSSLSSVIGDWMKKGFTLMEMLVVIAVLGLLMGILLPYLSRVREQAKITVVNAELRQISLCLEMYRDDNDGTPPPTRKDCTLGWSDHQLPPELVTCGYLPPPAPDSGMSAGVEDRFNYGNTYKYWSVGQLYQNGRFIPQKKASLYVPQGFPNCEEGPDKDLRYDDILKSPVIWVVFSQGPNFDEWNLINQLHGPVPKRTWYDPKKRSGIIVRMVLKDGKQIGSFEN